MNQEDLALLQDSVTMLTQLMTGRRTAAKTRGDTTSLPCLLHALVQTVCEDVEQLNAFISQLALGHLEAPPPGRKNFIASQVKGLHAKLKHLTWQTEQIQQGDYSQTVDFMGAFSNAFNHMIRTLKEREEGLTAEILLKEEARHALQRSNFFLNSVLSNITDAVMVVHDHNVLFANEKCWILFPNMEKQKEDSLLDALLDTKFIFDQTRPLELYDPNREKYYSITSLPIEWEDTTDAFLRIATDISDLKHKEERLTKIAYLDELTGIPNRRAGLAAFSALLKDENNFPISLCYIDMDKLKYVNDTFGHHQGDIYIRTMAHTLFSAVRGNDTVSRLGGDEFLIIFVRSKQETSRIVVERIEQALQERAIRDNLPYAMSFSFGIEEIAYGNPIDAQEYLNMADQKMYHLKNEKRKTDTH